MRTNRIVDNPVDWLPSDLVVGVTLAAYAIPAARADAALAGLPPQIGVYAIGRRTTRC